MIMRASGAGQKRGPWSESVVVLGVLLAVLMAIGSCGPVSPAIASADVEPTPQFRVGRSVCPGSVPRVLDNMGGGVADQVEALQTAHQDEPGFRAVVNDGERAVIVVDAAALADSTARMAGTGVGVAPSCVDARLRPVVEASMAQIELPPDGILSVGYNGLDDVIEVRGLTRDELMDAVRNAAPAAHDLVLRGFADGTLRMDR